MCYSVAIATKESLDSQKKSLYGITQKINTLASILLLINVFNMVCMKFGKEYLPPIGGVSALQ